MSKQTRMLDTLNGERRYKLLCMFAGGQILQGVDLELRRAVKDLLREQSRISTELLNHYSKDAEAEYWERWVWDEDQSIEWPPKSDR